VEIINSFAKKRLTMFGDMMGMLGKLQEAQKKVEATKERLKTVYVEHKSSDHLICIRLTADREIKSVEIDNSLLNDKEMLEDYLILHFNNAIEKATAIHDAELAAVAKEGMPNMPGMDMFK
jgi:DNA-binding YbaB/EbfC family protein